MSKEAFIVDASTILQLGRDSIKNPTTAVIELVKNGYDAGAENIKVNVNENEILIEDNGVGMDFDDIRSNWLRIGYSEKRLNKYTIDNKRRKTGEKGIGRLSADRLGELLHLTTRKDGGEPVELSLSWKDFEQDRKDISDIPVEVNIGETSTFKHGTRIVISKLRQQFGENDINQLHNELVALVSPFSRTKNFEVFFHNHILPELNGAVKSPYVDVAELSLEASYDGKGESFEVRIKDRSDPSKTSITNESLTVSAIDAPSGGPSLECGPINIQLLFYPRGNSNPLLKERGFSIKLLRDFLNAHAGIKIYRDDISVKPFGYNNEPAGDWLGLALRKERDPAGASRGSYKFSSYQLLGAVSFGRDTNPMLRDGAGREGLVENLAFMDLRALTLSCVEYLEAYRHMHFKPKPRDKKEKTVAEAAESVRAKIDAVDKTVDSINEDSTPADISRIKKDLKENVKEAIAAAEVSTNKSSEALDNVRVLAGMATVGISSAVFGHETQSAVAMLDMKIAAAVSALSKKSGPDVGAAMKNLKKASESSRRVGSWGAFAISRTKKDKRRRNSFNVGELADSVIEEIRDAIEASSILIDKDIEDIKFTGFAMDVESIILNLLTNAHFYAKKSKNQRKIAVALYENERDERRGFEIVVSDSGPGVEKIYKDQIWEPLFTTKKDAGYEVGTGLGLSIVKNTVEELKGFYDVEDDQLLGGAKFIIWIPYTT